MGWRGALAAIFLIAFARPAAMCFAAPDPSIEAGASNWVPVQSSVLAAIAYDGGKRTLDVEFRSGAVWRYFEVLPEVHRALLAAESKGRFYNANIRHRFKSHKIPAR